MQAPRTPQRTLRQRPRGLPPRSTTAASTTPTAGTTAPGTALALGAPATVNYKPGIKSNSPTYRLRVTVDSITKAPASDLNGVELEKEQQGKTPYYVKLSITNLGEGNASAEDGVPAVGFQTVDDRGQQGQELTLLGTFRPCDSARSRNSSHAASHTQRARSIWSEAAARSSRTSGPGAATPTPKSPSCGRPAEAVESDRETTSAGATALVRSNKRAVVSRSARAAHQTVSALTAARSLKRSAAGRSTHLPRRQRTRRR